MILKLVGKYLGSVSHVFLYSTSNLKTDLPEALLLSVALIHTPSPSVALDSTKNL